MKSIAGIIILLCLVCAAGCTTTSPVTGPVSSGPSLPTSVDSLSQKTPLPMSGHATVTTRNGSFEAWIDSFELGQVEADGNQELTIYIAVRNKGTQALRMTWFCKLTDAKGKSYGGIGVSHGGNGARSGWIPPNVYEAARDFVNIQSDRDVEALTKGGTLDVYFMENPSDDVPISTVPDYHLRWTVDPGAIR